MPVFFLWQCLPDICVLFGCALLLPYVALQHSVFTYVLKCMLSSVHLYTISQHHPILTCACINLYPGVTFPHHCPQTAISHRYLCACVLSRHASTPQHHPTTATSCLYTVCMLSRCLSVFSSVFTLQHPVLVYICVLVCCQGVHLYTKTSSSGETFLAVAGFQGSDDLRRQ